MERGEAAFLLPPRDPHRRGPLAEGGDVDEDGPGVAEGEAGAGAELDVVAVAADRVLVVEGPEHGASEGAGEEVRRDGADATTEGGPDARVGGDEADARGAGEVFAGGDARRAEGGAADHEPRAAGPRPRDGDGADDAGAEVVVAAAGRELAVEDRADGGAQAPARRAHLADAEADRRLGQLGVAIAVEAQLRLRDRGGGADQVRGGRRRVTFTARRTDGGTEASSLGGARRERDRSEGEREGHDDGAHATWWRPSGARATRYGARVRAFAISAVLIGCASAPAAPTPVAAERAPMLPALSFPLVDGTAWSSAALAGDVAVIDVWATYCAPCKKSFPQLNALAADGVAVVGLSVDEDDAAVAAFLTEIPAQFTIARDRTLTVQEPPLAITKLPTVLVVDAAGRVRLRLEEPAESDYAALPAVIAALRAR